MKVVALAVFATLAACKPDPTAKPAEGSVAPAATPVLRSPGPRPALPAAAATDDGSAAVPAPAEHKRPWLDKNGDGVITQEERDAARIARAKRVHDRYDANHDGKLTPDELAAAGAGHRGPRFANPAALDTDHDGEISPDELQKGLRELRNQRRHEQVDGSGE